MGLFSSIGGIVNDLTGASNSAKSSYKYNAALQNQNWAHQKEAMQNAHQWEVADLQAAGLNPALSAGGPGASTGGAGGGGGGVNAPMGDLSGLLNVLTGFGNLANSTKMTNAQTGLLDAQTTAQITNNKYIDDNMKSAILNTMADTSLKKAMTKNSAADTALKGQLKATSAADEKVKKEQVFLNRAQTTESAGRTAQIRYGKLAEKLGITQAGKIMNLLERLEAKGSKHNLWKIIDNWIGEK
jgi:hypothetical protein